MYDVNKTLEGDVAAQLTIPTVVVVEYEDAKARNPDVIGPFVNVDLAQEFIDEIDDGDWGDRGINTCCTVPLLPAISSVNGVPA